MKLSQPKMAEKERLISFLFWLSTLYSWYFINAGLRQSDTLRCVKLEMQFVPSRPVKSELKLETTSSSQNHCSLVRVPTVSMGLPSTIHHHGRRCTRVNYLRAGALREEREREKWRRRINRKCCECIAINHVSNWSWSIADLLMHKAGVNRSWLWSVIDCSDQFHDYTRILFSHSSISSIRSPLMNDCVDCWQTIEKWCNFHRCKCVVPVQSKSMTPVFSIMSERSALMMANPLQRQ